MSFDQASFDRFIIDNKVVGFFESPVTLKSGRQSYWYVNWRTPTSDAYLMDVVTDHIVEFVKDRELNPDCFYGVPEGATKTAVLSSLKWAKSQSNFGKGSFPLVMGRAKPKEHGVSKDKFYLGAPTGKTLLIEDTTTTGGSLMSELGKLTEQGVEVCGVLILTHRGELTDSGQSVSDLVYEKYGVSVHVMSEAPSILPQIMEKESVSDAVKRSVVECFEKYGEKKITLRC